MGKPEVLYFCAKSLCVVTGGGGEGGRGVMPVSCSVLSTDHSIAAPVLLLQQHTCTMFGMPINTIYQWSNTRM